MRKWRLYILFVGFWGALLLLTAVFSSFEGALADDELFEEIRINEIDYDQTAPGAGQDGAEFVELVNVGDLAADLDAYRLVFARGINNSRYMTVELPAVQLQPGNYFVVCSNDVIGVNCDYELGGLIADGHDGSLLIGDAVALLLGNVRIDSMSYEGNVAAFNEFSGEGLEDNGSDLYSGLSRFPDGFDSDTSNIDFSKRCITPGLPNIAQNTNCELLLTPEIAVTVTAVPSSVPEPGGVVNLSVRIDNLSILNIDLNSLTDNEAQNLNGVGSCQLPQILAGFGSYECAYAVEIAGNFEDEIVRSVTAVGEDDFNTPTSDSGQTSVTISERIHWDIFLPSVMKPAPQLYGEPNDTCANAKPLTFNQNYYFKAEDQEDWYFFDLNTAATVRVTLQNFVPAGGNLSVWRGICGELDFVGSDGSTAVNRTINLGLQPAGHYLVWLISDPPYNNTELYSLQLDSP